LAAKQFSHFATETIFGPIYFQIFVPDSTSIIDTVKNCTFNVTTSFISQNWENKGFSNIKCFTANLLKCCKKQSANL